MLVTSENSLYVNNMLTIWSNIDVDIGSYVKVILSFILYMYILANNLVVIILNNLELSCSLVCTKF